MRTNFFFKNSSLVTNRHNRLYVNAIERDELKIPLVTRDEWDFQLITPYTADNQNDTWRCDE